MCVAGDATHVWCQQLGANEKLFSDVGKSLNERLTRNEVKIKREV